MTCDPLQTFNILLHLTALSLSCHSVRMFWCFQEAERSKHSLIPALFSSNQSNNASYTEADCDGKCVDRKVGRAAAMECEWIHYRPFFRSGDADGLQPGCLVVRQSQSFSLGVCMLLLNWTGMSASPASSIHSKPNDFTAPIESWKPLDVLYCELRRDSLLPI